MIGTHANNVIMIMMVDEALQHSNSVSHTYTTCEPQLVDQNKDANPPTPPPSSHIISNSFFQKLTQLQGVSKKKKSISNVMKKSCSSSSQKTILVQIEIFEIKMIGHPVLGNKSCV